MKLHFAIWTVILLFAANNLLLAQEKISIAGTWKVQLDGDSNYYRKQVVPRNFANSIKLPGTTDEAKLGARTSGSDYGILTRAYKHIGPAWYEREIVIPNTWEDKRITLFLERVLWESKVFIDGKEVSTLSPLYVPHEHQLGKLRPGKHILTICINNDMIHNIGDKGHGYTEYTQSIWNGIVGRMELAAHGELSAGLVKAYPDADKGLVSIRASLQSVSEKQVTLKALLKDPRSGRIVKTVSKKIPLAPGEQTVDLTIEGLTGIKLWDEFDPYLYEVSLVAEGAPTTLWSDKIGFRKLSTATHKILINDKVTFIRGNLDCVHFPLTGYPSCNVRDWELIFKKYKDFGLNTVRFHSWTPPGAAFEAADKMGIYIQTEIIWLDWWMAGEQKDRPEMNTKGYPQGLGKNPNADAFVQAEMKRVLDAYGNHPSFMFFCIGNELGNSDFDVMQQWIKNVKNTDPRRLYAVSTARKIMPVDDYMVTHNIPNVGGTYGYSLNKTDAGLEANYSKATIPIIAHEVGQAPVYPLWSEIDKYKGVLKARNLEEFKAKAEKNGIALQDVSFQKSTGLLQQLLYKNLIENITLSPSAGGYQLLSMQDYQGQGEALIGWLDCFWDDKKTTSPTLFKGYSNAVAPLIRTKTFTYTRADTLSLFMEVANHYKTDLNDQLNWEIIDRSGKILYKGIAAQQHFPQGQLTKADSLKLSLHTFPQQAAAYTFRLKMAKTGYTNSWTFFIYPPADKITVDAGEVLVSNEWNEAVDKALAKGGKVLLLADKLGTKKTSGAVSFTPLFWSASFFPGQSNETLGSFLDTSSKAFSNFPTQSFTNWQWFNITQGARYFKLSALPATFQPLAQPVSDFHYNEKLGSIFEARVGNGKLLVCGYNLNQKNNAYAQQLYYSLINYMKSTAFIPRHTLTAAPLKEVLMKAPEAVQETPLPNQFKNATFFVKAAAKATAAKNWQAKDDSVVVNKNYTYRIGSAYSVVQPAGKAWDGTNFSINLQTPAGVKGYIYFYLINDARRKGRGTITIEGRELQTGEIPVEGKWVKIFMMREDTNDGKVTIGLTSDGAAPLLVNQLVIMEEE